jgi:hypothetical protein
MSFLTYESTRPWARAIKAAVLLRKMPPWFADPSASHFLNDPTLPNADINALAKWADDGALPGDPKEAPPAVAWPQGWQIQPDVIVEGPTTEIPAHPKNNVMEWITMTIPSGFAKDLRSPPSKSSRSTPK